MNEYTCRWFKQRKRVSEIVEMGAAYDWPSRIYDILGFVMLLINLIATFLYTFAKIEAQYGDALLLIESVTVAFFAIDYVLRAWAEPSRHPDKGLIGSTCVYVLSFSGIIDLLSFLPYYLPIVFPAGTAVFRIFRVVRIFRLFQINAYYSSMSVITEVLQSKRQQLASSVFIIFVLMLASSLCMYSLEHAAQPDVFTNAFSGLWWAVSTLLTIGYGDIYPITIPGKIISIFITFLGVGMVAIPTGIISAGFVDQYSRLKRIGEYAQEEDIHFIKIHLQENDSWANQTINDLSLPHGIVVAIVRRGRHQLVPRGDLLLQKDDILVLAAEAMKDDTHIDLKEIVLGSHHPWTGQLIRDLDISRKSIVVMVKRQDTMLIPRGNLQLLEGDHVILYSQSHISTAEVISV